MKKGKKPNPISFICFFMSFILLFFDAVSRGRGSPYIGSFFILAAGIIELVNWIKWVKLTKWIKSMDKDKENEENK